MRIAVPVEEGKIFQHFGKTETFKIYEVQDNEVLYSEYIDTFCGGHSALANVLSDNAINVLVCGGIGMGAQVALDDAGIEMVTGIEGDADEAVEKYLKGELTNGGATCGHHHEDGHCCGHHHEEGGCCGHHHEEGHCCKRQVTLEGKNAGRTCRVHYKGTLNDGTQFDSSYDRGEPIEFVCGAGMMIAGFDKAVVDMEVGEVKDIHLMPEEAYGPSNPDLVFTVDIASLPGSEDLEIGQRVFLSNPMGNPFPVTITYKDTASITFDANHEMAGKELNFSLELVEVI